jgi:aminoglycoside phosphotransferase (APT) family kinase protein
VTGLPARNARKRILAALDERASGGAGTLDSDDAARLDEWLAKEPVPSPDEIAALARQRAERLAAILRDDHGIEERRLAIVDAPAAEPQKTSPGVKVTIALPG